MKKQDEKSEKEYLKEISEKMDKIIGIIAASSVKEPKDKVSLLKDLGFTIENTAKITGLTIDVVKKERSKLKESKKWQKSNWKKSKGC